MKRMKLILLITALLTSQLSISQDYFAVVVKDDQTTYNYPANVDMILVDEHGDKKKIKKGEALTVNGNYTLSIAVPWKEQPEILSSDGGTLEIFVLPVENREYEYGEKWVRQESTEKEELANKAILERKEITISKSSPDNYNLLAVFRNGIVFRYNGGQARAWLNGKEIEVTNRYLVQSPDGILKISFDESTGEFWYVFDEEKD